MSASKKKLPTNGTALGKTLKNLGLGRKKSYVYNTMDDFNKLNLTSIVYTEPSSINPKILTKIENDYSPRSSVLKKVIENRTNFGPLHGKDPKGRAEKLLDWQKSLIGRTNQNILEIRRNKLIDKKFEKYENTKKKGGRHRRRTCKKNH